MSFELGGKVLEDLDITDSRQYCVMMCLADATSKETGFCYPSLGRIAAVARCDRRTAIRALDQLETKGWIQVIRRKDKNGSPLVNFYRITKYANPSVKVTLPPQCQGDTRVVSRVRRPSVKVPPPPSVTVTPDPIREEEPIREPKKYAPEELVLLGDLEKKKTNKPRAVACNPPSIEEFVSYAVSIGAHRTSAEKQYAIWSESGWRDGHGTVIFSWKGKLQTFQAKDCFAYKPPVIPFGVAKKPRII